MKTIAFFNNKGGVGKTSLVYHLAWMYADLGVSVIAADLDPQANLTSMFLPEESLEELWPDNGPHNRTVLGFVSPILRGLGDVAHPHVERVDDRLGLVAGDLGLSRFEARLSAAWPDCMTGSEAAFRTVSAFHRILLAGAEEAQAEIVLIDVGPNLGAINQAAIIAAQHVAVPLAPDLFSLQGLRNLGPTLREWRRDWEDRLGRKPNDSLLELPQADMHPAGYIVMQHAVRADRPVKAYKKWFERIPQVYRTEVLDDHLDRDVPYADDDNCLATLKHYRSLMPMAQEARKPIFHLRAAEGAIGGHASAVLECRKDFEKLARAIAQRCDVAMP